MEHIQLTEAGDSCLRLENYECAVENYSKIQEDKLSFDSVSQKLEFYLHYSDALYAVGNYSSAHIYYQKLKAIAIGHQNRFYEGKAYTGAAHSLWRLTDNVRSIQEILKAVEIFTILKDTSNLIEASNILAGVYVSIQNYDDAEDIYNEMLDIAVQANDSVNIACSFEYLGVIDFFKGNFFKAIVNYNKSFEINEKLDETFNLAINLSNIAEAHVELGEYQKALETLNRAVSIQKQYNYKSVLIFSFYTLGKIYTQLDKYDSGRYYYNSSLKLMDETSETRDKNEVLRLIAKNFEKQGDFRMAYEFHQKYSVEKDSLLASERRRHLDEIQTRYEVEGKVRENKYLQLQNSEKQKELVAQSELIQMQYTIGILIAIFLIISLFLAFRLYRVRQTLINANRSKDKVFGIIAHDLKGPIGNIKAMVKMVQLEEKETQKAQYFKYLEQTVQNLAALTNQLLSWTFSNKGDFDFEIEKLGVREISNRTIELFDYQLVEKKITVVNSIRGQLFVLADENALLTIFRNIISNAIKFTKRGGSIKLDAEVLNDLIAIKIMDDGVGMTKSAMEKVLRGQHVISSSGTDNEKGSGLGFSIVTEFVRKLKGEIDIESDEESGTTIILKLKKAKG